MTNTLMELFSKEQKDAFAKRLSEAVFKDIVEKTKAADASDVGTFKFLISTDSLDRQGDVVDQKALDFTNYKMNPVVLWGHDYYNLPIGVTDKITTDGGKTYAEGRFAPTDEAQKIRKYVNAGYPLGASIGYILTDRQGETITGAEVLEWSMCAIPANQDCIPIQSARLKLTSDDLAFLQTKGIKFMEKTKTIENKKKDAEVGDSCEMDDGTPGTMADQDGQLVCVPNEEKAEKPNEENDDTNPDRDELDNQLDEDMKAEHADHAENSKSILEKCAKAIDEFEEAKGLDEFKEKAIEEFGKCYKAMAGEHGRHASTVQAMIDEYREKMTATSASDDPVKGIKSGAAISKANKEKIQNAHDSATKAINHATKCVTALKGILEGGEAEEKPDEGKSAEKVEPKGINLDGVNNVVAFKGVLKGLATALGETLEVMNNDVQKKSKH
jgi:hypothetical protein